MDHNKLKTSLMKIEILWESILKEKSDDSDAYDYISIQSMSLKMATLNLKDNIEELINKDKREKLKLQKLYSSLVNIIKILDFKLLPDKDKVKLLPDKDKAYIESILDKLSKIRKDIVIIKEYQ